MIEGVIEGKPVYALLDSGSSTHSFIDPSTLQGVTCKVANTVPLVVMVANGEKMVTNSKCTDLKFTIQQQGFEG